MTKRAGLALKSPFYTNSYTLPKITTKVVHPLPKMRKRADLGLNSLFCTNSCTSWKLPKSGVLSAKITKRVDLGLSSLFCTNSCTLLKTVKKWCTKCENDKTWWFRAENFCFVQTRALKSGVPLAKMTEMGVLSGKFPKYANLGLKTCVLYKLVHFAANR